LNFYRLLTLNKDNFILNNSIEKRIMINLKVFIQVLNDLNLIEITHKLEKALSCQYNTTILNLSKTSSRQINSTESGL
jgi:hypothetical protein